MIKIILFNILPFLFSANLVLGATSFEVDTGSELHFPYRLLPFLDDTDSSFLSPLNDPESREREVCMALFNIPADQMSLLEGVTATMTYEAGTFEVELPIKNPLHPSHRTKYWPYSGDTYIFPYYWLHYFLPSETFDGVTSASPILIPGIFVIPQEELTDDCTVVDETEKCSGFIKIKTIIKNPFRSK